MSENVQDISVSIGIAVLGSLAIAIYRRTMLGHLPDTLGDAARVSASDSLWAASAIAPDLPTRLIEEAKNALISGFNGAAVVSADSMLVLAVLAAFALRRNGTLGPTGERV
ncbi:hypothetical protein [Rhodophyticola porphyridii]|uniref:hypothetical protein n=1 Tax=Rhodophyticola porphyridii TaxID=1852017 RepID=UPI0035D0A560